MKFEQKKNSDLRKLQFLSKTYENNFSRAVCNFRVIPKSLGKYSQVCTYILLDGSITCSELRFISLRQFFRYFSIPVKKESIIMEN